MDLQGVLGVFLAVSGVFNIWMFFHVQQLRKSDIALRKVFLLFRDYPGEQKSLKFYHWLEKVVELAEAAQRN